METSFRWIPWNAWVGGHVRAAVGVRRGVVGVAASILLAGGLVGCTSGEWGAPGPSAGGSDSLADVHETANPDPSETAGPDQPLLGTRWDVDSVVDGDSVRPAPPDAQAYVVLEDEDGLIRVTGYTGCNTFGGFALVDEATITFLDVRLTERACVGSLGILEAAVRPLVLYGLPVAYTIDAGRLTLTGPDGKGVTLHPQ